MKSKQTSIVFSPSATRDKIIDEFLNKIVPAIEDNLKPSRMVVEVCNEDEYGNDLSSERIFEIAENKFEDEKDATGLEYCWLYKVNDYVVIIGVKR